MWISWRDDGMDGGAQLGNRRRHKKPWGIRLAGIRGVAKQWQEDEHGCNCRNGETKREREREREREKEREREREREREKRLNEMQ